MKYFFNYSFVGFFLFYLRISCLVRYKYLYIGLRFKKFWLNKSDIDLCEMFYFLLFCLMYFFKVYGVFDLFCFN